ncbi:hypothetical protein PASE110613_07055 [Paenibacillus sediminis]|uniref:N-acetyltransferase n=1 Tax=Paenibacillus sediminis TaxID=664909 RepID=A0ABS4H202_9BACL|nr:hypothetical protein [Paenibacillus sediminis]MBP1936545.1 hypothetical protein [Paenibacillus sediminis]
MDNPASGLEGRDRPHNEDYGGNIYGMDQFIGETEYWNKGIGTDLI